MENTKNVFRVFSKLCVFSVMFSLVFLAGGVYTTSASVPNQAPVIYLTPSKFQVCIGDTYFNPVKYATARDAEDGNMASKLVITNPVNIQKEGKYYVKYSVTDSQGARAEKIMTVNVVQCKKVVIPTPTLSFIVTKKSITKGESVKIVWHATNANSCTASGHWYGKQEISSNASVSPSFTNTYTLKCSGDGGSITKSVTIVVKPKSTPAPDPKPTPKVEPKPVPVSTPEIISASTTTTICCSTNNIEVVCDDGDIAGTSITTVVDNKQESGNKSAWEWVVAISRIFFWILAGWILFALARNYKEKRKEKRERESAIDNFIAQQKQKKQR